MSNQVIPLKRTPLALLKAERINSPWSLLVYGLPGLGKSTFAAQFPAPVFICAERAGADQLEVARYPEPLEGWRNVREAVQRLTDEPHDFKTLVIDTIDDVEPLCWAHVVESDKKATNIENVGGGYGRGYQAAVDIWRTLLNDLEQLQAKRGMHVVLVAHPVRRNFKDPERENYDRWEPNLHKQAAGLLVAWCKAVLFAQEEIGTTKLDGGKDAKPKAVRTGGRVLRTIWSPAYDAKNRYELPDPLPLDYQAFVEACKRAEPVDLDVLRIAVETQLRQLEQVDAERAKNARLIAESVKDQPVKLKEVHRRLAEAIAETAMTAQEGA